MELAPTARRVGPRTHRAWTLVATAALTGALAAGCTGGAGADGACGQVRREPLDPRSVHALPGADTTTYRTDPPTSGPHLPSPSTESVRDAPIPAAIQVGLLEEGDVLIQHEGLSSEDRSAVEALAGEGVVVAPADDPLPDGAAVVATAWVTKQSCTAVDTGVLETFVVDQEGNGPGEHG